MDSNKNPWIILECLSDIILYNIKGCIVEIGMGFSTSILSNIAEKHSVNFYTCDKSHKTFNKVKDGIEYENFKPYFATSEDFMKSFNDTPAVVFLDGDHSYDILKQEVYFFLDKMLYGGVLFMHDTTPIMGRYESKIEQGRKMTTHLMRKEIELNKDYDVFTWRYTAANCGLTMVLKKDLSEPFYRV